MANFHYRQPCLALAWLGGSYTLQHVKPKLLSPAIIILLLPPLFWAGNFIIGRAARDTISPMTLSLWRWIIAFLFILPFAWKHVRRDWHRYTSSGWLIVRLSLAGVVAFNSLVYIGLQTTTASNALLLNSCIPILIAIIGAVFYKQRLYGAHYVGLVLSCLGVIIIITHGDINALRKLEFSSGDLLIFCAMVSFAFYTLWLRKVPDDINRLGLMAAQIAISFLFLIPLWAFEGRQVSETQWSMSTLAALLYLGIFPSVLSYFFFNLGVARFGAAQAGQCIHLIPVFGAVLAIFFLNETFHLYHAIGMAAILWGIRLTVNAKVTPNQSET